MSWRLGGETLPVLAGIVALAAWAYLLLARGAFWRVSRLRAPAAAAPPPPGRVAAVIAARNEADVIGRGIASLLSQSCGESFHIFLVDDSSNDGTEAIRGPERHTRSGREAGGDNADFLQNGLQPALQEQRHALSSSGDYSDGSRGNGGGRQKAAQRSSTIGH